MRCDFHSKVMKVSQFNKYQKYIKYLLFKIYLKLVMMNHLFFFFKQKDIEWCPSTLEGMFFSWQFPSQALIFLSEQTGPHSAYRSLLLDLSGGGVCLVIVRAYGSLLLGRHGCCAVHVSCCRAMRFRFRLSKWQLTRIRTKVPLR